MGEAERLVRQLYAEAVSACGDDVGAIDRYVADRVAALGEEDRARFSAVIERLLAFQAPARRPDHCH